MAFGQLPEGQYQARVAGAADDEIGAVTAFDVRRGNLQELLEVEARPDQMKFIAEQSGGALLTDTDPGLLARQFDEHLTRTRPVRTAQTTAWDRWWVLLAAFCVWGGAWGLRRFSGLV